MNKRKLKNKLFNFLGSFDGKTKTKFKNICGKTGKYDVPNELYQKRTNRKNRVLISWKTVKNNNFTLKQLETFSGGVAVEFVNNDFFDEENQTDPLFLELKDRLGSDETVASIITIRSESGSSSSSIQRQAFEKLVNNTKVTYKGDEVTLKLDNYKDYSIKRIQKGGIGNEKWTGFLFISIKGGQQDVIESNDCEQRIFNPACDFANEDISLDLDLTMSYFAMQSIQIKNLEKNKQYEYESLLQLLKETLATICYDNEDFKGTLLKYCQEHPSTKMVPGKLYDPIQVEEIHISDFAIDNKEDPRNLDFTHDEAVNKGKYYWDNIKQCILSPARPTNVFWSKHLSNMMQQNFSLNEYFKHEEDVTNRRRKFLND